ncbi:ABC transporter substrate-binding protein [Staphylococcus petrasii]|uniref:ABC transporter substrate-binding protein n=1 Tax=Staphylococcus petrasii TaxID=1276936 RepID=UPI000CD25AE3|nr:ABC transporter substrate-binding protein [Staphylococcus petrasii]PNZ84099.1 nickel ABC transporter substrate-binding protein [Staphylococcus petrasii]TGA81416.1 nickel ABC transporter substrate-binding protein [Staphylococcus petrasii]SUM58891.1 Nickel ABC transporter periplasmic nickel-binding protein NikA [Staphylococcus petrasii]
MKKRVFYSLSMCAMLILSGCATHNDDKKEVKVSLPREFNPKHLDAQAFDVPMPVYSAVYQPLVTYGKGGKIEPGLATSWKASDDGKDYIFHLKRNVKFNDGSDFDASAVKFSIERAKATDKTDPMETLDKLQSVNIKDKYTVEIKLKEPSNQVLPELTQIRPLRIMSPHAVKDGATTGKFEKAIGTGPFKVADSTNETVTFKPNQYYHNGHPLDYDLTFQSIEDSDSRHLAIESRSIDIAGGALGQMTPQQVKESYRNKDLKVHTYPSTETQFMGFNPQNKVLKDKRIREAISKAIDTNDLSHNKKLKGLFQSDVRYVNSSNQHDHTYDPSESEKLIKEVGYKKNSNGYFEKDGKVLSLKLALQTDEFPEWKTKAEIMQQALKKVGIKLDINILDSQTYYETLTVRKDFDLIYYRTYTNALMPYNFLNARFKQADHQPGAFADDSKLTEMIKKFPTIINMQQRQSAFDKLSNYIDHQYLAVPISYPNETFVTTPKISNFEFSGQTDAPINFDKLKVKNNE